MEARPGILVMADISGYTQFLHHPDVSLLHAQHLVGRLLGAVVETGEPILKAEKLEGDAVLFLRPSDRQRLAEDAVLARDRLLPMWEAFEAEKRAISAINECICDGCNQVPALQLKLFCHVDEVARHSIGRFDEIGGPGVVLIHRLLKNSIDAAEYVLMSDSFHQLVGGLNGHTSQPHMERYEHIGEVSTVLYLLQSDGWQPPESELNSRSRSTREWLEQLAAAATPTVNMPQFRNLPAV